MHKRLSPALALSLACSGIAAGVAAAGEADVVGVEVSKESGGNLPLRRDGRPW